MPLKLANARFNFNMMYVKQFGIDGDNTMLPRQFYRIPAHKQYNIWPKWLSWTCGNSVALLSLYLTIQNEDWFAVRRHPQFLGRGWSAKCVPNERQRECCPTPSPLSAFALGFNSVPSVLVALVVCGALLVGLTRYARKSQRRLALLRSNSDDDASAESGDM